MPAAARAHVRDRLAAEHDRRAQIDLPDQLQPLQRDLLDAPLEGDPRVVDEDVEAPEFGHGGVDQRLRVLDVAHVGADGEPTAAGLLDLADDGVDGAGQARVRLLLAAGGNGDGHAEPAEVARDVRADPAARSRNDRDLAF